MDMKELTYVITIAEEGSISAAAEKLFMAQSSLSQALRLYEAELGTPIFMRTPQGVRPTAAGSAFIQRARQILQSYHLAKSEMWDIEALQGGRVLLGISSFRGEYLLPPVLRRFREKYPKVLVEILEMDSIYLGEQVAKGVLDLALIAHPPAGLREVERLTQDEVLIVAEKSHPVMELARPCPDQPGEFQVEFRDTVDFDYILGPSQSILGQLAREEFRKCNREPKGSNHNITASFAAAMARGGLGLSLTYRSCIVPDENVRYLHIGERGVWVDLVLAYPAGEYRSRAAKALARSFREVYGGKRTAGR